MAKDRRKSGNKIGTGIKLRPDIYARIEEYARLNNRSFSNAIEALAIIALKKEDANSLAQLLKKMEQIESKLDMGRDRVEDE